MARGTGVIRSSGVLHHRADRYRASDTGQRFRNDLTAMIVRPGKRRCWKTCGLSAPTAGENFDTVVDCSAESQRYIEDCPVCCNPIEFEAEVDGEGNLITLMTRRDDD